MNKTLLTLLAGVVAGILLAPDKGSETLKKVRNWSKNLKDQATDKMNDLASEGKDAFASGRNRFNEALGQ